MSAAECEPAVPGAKTATPPEPVVINVGSSRLTLTQGGHLNTEACCKHVAGAKKVIRADIQITRPGGDIQRAWGLVNDERQFSVILKVS